MLCDGQVSGEWRGVDPRGTRKCRHESVVHKSELMGWVHLQDQIRARNVAAAISIEVNKACKCQ